MPSLGAKEQAMSINAIQFQRGLSLPQFQALYGSEQQCELSMVTARQRKTGMALIGLATPLRWPIKVIE